jgi:hypothetical protein
MSTEPLFDVEDLGDVVVITPTRNMGEFEIANIDLSRTDYFGSSTIGLFIQLVKHVHANNHAIAFCNLSKHEREIAGITHVSEILDVLDSHEAALEFVRNAAANPTK